jgi:pimeloyl-ACP methyl ester carboxylesterase
VSDEASMTTGAPESAGNGAIDTRSPRDVWFANGPVRIHGLDWGGPADGPPMLFLHGVGGNAWIWDDVAPRLREVLPTHRLVALDGRDGGDTDHPPTGYERDDFVGDVLAAHDALGGRPMVLVGHSRGGWLAAWLAAAHPDRVAALVLVDPARLVFATVGDADRFYDWVRAALGPFDGEDAAIAAAMDEHPTGFLTDVRRRSILFGLRRDADGRLVGKLPLEVVPQLRRARENGEVVTEALGKVRAPTLLLVAERQAESRRADKLAYADRIPGVRVLRLDGSHFLHSDCPAEVAGAIAGFVGAETG